MFPTLLAASGANVIKLFSYSMTLPAKLASVLIQRFRIYNNFCFNPWRKWMPSLIFASQVGADMGKAPYWASQAKACLVASKAKKNGLKHWQQAVGNPVVDYLSLDTEGTELDVSNHLFSV